MIHGQNSGNKNLIVSFSFIASMGRHIFKSFSICNKVKKKSESPRKNCVLTWSWHIFEKNSRVFCEWSSEF